MDTSAAQAPLFDAGDAEWVADLFDTMRAGDLDIVIDRLESVAVLMRKAAKARRMLATIEPDLLRAGLRIRDTRDGAS
ncbi:MAG: hypothetical protein ABIR39_18880 [Nocardioides sp.]|uniref:hypothetical protein n=1 Tax=Nocardioides sp. TaxID=35761 RepID=UPI003264F4A5